MDLHQSEWNSGNQSVYYETMSGYTTKTFMWMFLGLLTTFGVALACFVTNVAYYLFSIPSMFMLLALVELGVVIAFTAMIHKASVATARALFFTYAAVNGVVFSSYLWLYELGDILLAFVSAAFYFGIMAAYGYFTKKDLSGWRTPLMIGLIAMLVVGLLGMFLGGMMVAIYCMAGVVIFACYTAYDTQKIKDYYIATAGQEELAKKASIYAALNLYLDFINLFLYLLRIFARNKD